MTHHHDHGVPSGGHSGHASTDTSGSAREFWEDFYRERHVWSGNPNPLLVREAEKLQPGTALDLGCGEGADAVWLAQHGWRVTAVDVATTALERASAHAAEAGVADRITWQQHDLARSLPSGSYDLVSAQFLHSPVAEEGERESILRDAASLVAPGGVLLIASHAGPPSWATPEQLDVRFPTVAEVVDELELPPESWTVDVAERVELELEGPDGQPGRRDDTVVRVRRIR